MARAHPPQRAVIEAGTVFYAYASGPGPDAGPRRQDDGLLTVSSTFEGARIYAEEDMVDVLEVVATRDLYVDSYLGYDSLRARWDELGLGPRKRDRVALMLEAAAPGCDGIVRTERRKPDSTLWVADATALTTTARFRYHDGLRDMRPEVRLGLNSHGAREPVVQYAAPGHP